MLSKLALPPLEGGHMNLKMNPHIQAGYDDYTEGTDYAFRYWGMARQLYLFGREYAQNHESLAEISTHNGLVAK